MNIGVYIYIERVLKNKYTQRQFCMFMIARLDAYVYTSICHVQTCALLLLAPRGFEERSAAGRRTPACSACTGVGGMIFGYPLNQI